MSKRLFFGIHPSPEILRELEACQQAFREMGSLKAQAKECRWIGRDSLHLTLHFLGSVEEAQEKEILAAISALKWPSACEQKLDHFVAFPRKSAASVAGIGGLNGPLEEIYIRMKAALTGLAKLEERRFYPHVTLVRFRDSVSLKEPLPVFSPVDWPISSVALYQSHPSPNGSRYEILKEFPLAR